MLIIPLWVSASLPLNISTEELVKNSDHMLVGHVIDVDMIDGRGHAIKDLEARTGPGSDNKIRLIIQVDEVIKTNAKSVPKTLKVPLDSFMHFKYGQIKKAHEGDTERFLLLLKGPDFQPPFAGTFRRELIERDRIVELFSASLAAE
jgi:hypothetical protein